jgi:Mrp family chromosome partitioning ATPase
MAANVPEVAVGPIEAFWRYRHRSVPAVLAVALLAVLANLWSDGDAVAVTAIHLTDPRGVPMFRDGTTAATDLESYASQRAEFATSDIVIRATAEALGAPVEATRRIATAHPTAGARVALECRDRDAALALSVCVALADAYIDASRADTARRAELALASLRLTRQALIDERLARQPDAAPSSGAIEQIEVQIAQTALKAALFDAGVEFVDAPLLADSSMLTSAARAGIAALALGTLAAAGSAWAAAARRPMVDDPDVVAAHLGAPLLGHLPELGTSVEAVADDLATIRPTGVLVVTSDDGTGTADVVAALGDAWAREGRSVVMIDARPGRAELSQRFDTLGAGFADVVAGMASFDETIIRLGRRTSGSALVEPIHVLGSGHPVEHLASLLRAPRTRELLGRLRQTYELVVVDAPPLLDNGEGAVLAGLADGVVVVLSERTALRRLTALRQRLDVLGSPLVGVVTDPNPSPVILRPTVPR